jgi:hypothetical protein
MKKYAQGTHFGRLYPGKGKAGKPTSIYILGDRERLFQRGETPSTQNIPLQTVAYQETLPSY